MSKSDNTLSYLLDLDGYIINFEKGYRVSFSAQEVKKSTLKKPLGIKYSLVLLSPDGTRILGYDNAHSFPGAKMETPDDHKHKGERTVKYDYVNAEKLLIDFWKDVDQEFKKLGR